MRRLAELIASASRSVPACAPGVTLIAVLLAGARGSIEEVGFETAAAVAALFVANFVFVYAYLYAVIGHKRAVRGNLAVVLRTIDSYVSTVTAFAGLYYGVTVLLSPGSRLDAWSDGMPSDHRDVLMSITYYATTLLYTKPPGSPYPVNWILLALSTVQFMVFGVSMLGIVQDKLQDVVRGAAGGAPHAAEVAAAAAAAAPQGAARTSQVSTFNPAPVLREVFAMGPAGGPGRAGVRPLA